MPKSNIGYSINAAYLVRRNPDGSVAVANDIKKTVKGTLVTHKGGIVGTKAAATFDLAGIVDPALTVRYRNTTADVSIDLSAIAVPATSAITDVLTALGGGVFPTPLTFSKTTDNRIKVIAPGAAWVDRLEISGELAEALGIDFQWIEVLDPKSADLSPDVENGSENKQTSGRRTIATIREKDNLKGVKVAFEDAEANPDVERIVTGTIQSDEGDYIPSSGELDPAKFCMVTVQKRFSEGTTDVSDFTGVNLFLVTNIKGAPSNKSFKENSFDTPKYDCYGYDNDVSELPAYIYRQMERAAYLESGF